MTCPPGYHPRRAYTLKRTGSLMRSRNHTRRSPGTRRHERGETGQIVRVSCINDVGNPGKGPRNGGPGIGPLRKGDLKKFGYDNVVSMPKRNRQNALSKAVRSYGSLTVWRKLNAIYVYTRNTAPASSAIFKADRDWVKETYGIRVF